MSKDSNSIRSISNAQAYDEVYVTIEGAEELIEDGKVISFKKDAKAFANYLFKENLSPATVTCYTTVIDKYFKEYRVITKTNLLKWKASLVEHYMPQGVNQKIHAMNKYLTYINRRGLKLKSVKVQRKQFLENVISFEDYKYFLMRLKRDYDYTSYFLVKFIACTGARVSELVKFRVEDVNKGYMDIVSKGGKYRRIYIPNKLREEALLWLERDEITYGPIFMVNDHAIKSSTVNARLKKAAKKYPKIPIECIYPHSFRHMYAKKLISEGIDLLLLADLMGHSSLEITRMYTKMTSAEQAAIVNRIVTW